MSSIQYRTVKKFSIFQFWEINKYNTTKLYKNNIKQFDIKKYKGILTNKWNHYQLKLKIKNNNFLLFKNTNFVYLSCGTDKEKYCQEIGTVIHKNKPEIQYIHHNYKTFVDARIDEKLFKIGNHEKELEVTNKIIEVFKSNNNVEILQEKLSKNAEYFDTCVKFTQKIDNCYQHLMINYGTHADLIFNLYFYK